MRASDGSAEQRLLDRHYEVSKLVDTICGKLGQMLPSMINILIIMVDDNSIVTPDVMAAMLHLKERAEQKESDFIRRKGFSDRSDFFKHYHRLSGIVVRSSWNRAAEKPPTLWINAQAKHPIPAEVRTILQR